MSRSKSPKRNADGKGLTGNTASFACLLLLCAGTSAQQLTQPSEFAAETGIDEPRRYAVEVIIFEYNANTPGDTEVFVPDPLPMPDYFPEDGDMTILDSEDGQLDVMDANTIDNVAVENTDSRRVVESGVEADQAPEAPEFSPEEMILKEIPGPQHVQMKILEADQYSLGDTYQRLVQLDAYSPLLHAGWTQTAEENGEIRAIKLRRLGDPPLRLDGTLTLYLGRYLHLAVDLELEDRTSSTGSTEAAPYFGDAPMRSGYGFDDYGRTAPQTVYFRIDEDRIFRNGELRYFDHPRFGVLAKVSRVGDDGLTTEPGDPPVAGGPAIN